MSAAGSGSVDADADADWSAGGGGATEGPEPRTGLTPSRIVAIVVAVGLLAFVLVLFTRQPQETRFGPNQIVGRAVPKVSGTTLDGEQLDIDRLRGKWVVVNFFATWCVPCRQEHPELVRFVQEHEAVGDVEVVSVAFSDTEEALREFFARNGGDWPVIVNDDGATAISFGVTGVPESYVIAPNGRVVAQFEGVTQAGLNQVIAEAGGTGVVSPGATAVPAGAGGGS